MLKFYSKLPNLKFSLLLIIIVSFLGLSSPVIEEGMYPLSEIHKVNLVKAGLKINPQEIYNPNGISLIDALVKVNGCTGSFVSRDGLIITNHHCAFAAINNASTTEHNYLEDGFLASSRGEEISAKNYKCRITESYEDVSELILSAVEGIDDFAERAKAITKKMNELSEEATDKENSIEGSVSEMFAGQTYILFKYRIIEDVRLVYVPPRSIGEFGGETDNWVWPRHTGDFTFMRAYVAPDGSSAEYSPDNVPFTPKRFLKVNPKGVEEGDFAFVLGYPGRTYRHKPSQFLEYQYNYQLPYISHLYEWTMNLIEDKTKDDKKLSLEYSTHIKRLANVMKNYKGKLKGLRRTGLIEKRQEEEKLLQDFINSDAEMKEKYGNLFFEIDAVYSKMFDYAEANIWFSRLYRLSDNFKLADFAINYAEQKEMDDSDRDKKFKKDNVEKSVKKLDETFEIYLMSIENELIIKMFLDASKFTETSRIVAIDDEFGNDISKDELTEFVNSELLTSQIISKEYFDDLLEMSFEEIKDLDDPLIQFSLKLKEQYDALKDEKERMDGALSKLSPQLSEVKRVQQETLFIPDANSTLRLTYGYIKGYTPADAIYYSPITSLDGIIDKSYAGGDYQIPAKLRELYKNKDFGQFYNKKLKSIPVGLLYNMDTTGGNSGSPILDAYGNLVGVNFDRAFEATINDYAWNESYSRSIGVDIRYILWITQKLGGADFLLQEMGVEVK